MKCFALLLSLLFFTSSAIAQSFASQPLTAKLRAGYPPQAAFFVNEYKPTHLQYTSLATGTDSLTVVIGTFQLGETRGYYALTHFLAASGRLRAPTG